jgi:hypothetical protein
MHFFKYFVSTILLLAVLKFRFLFNKFEVGQKRKGMNLVKEKCVPVEMWEEMDDGQ